MLVHVKKCDNSEYVIVLFTVVTIMIVCLIDTNSTLPKMEIVQQFRHIKLRKMRELNNMTQFYLNFSPFHTILSIENT